MHCLFVKFVETQKEQKSHFQNIDIKSTEQCFFKKSCRNPVKKWYNWYVNDMIFQNLFKQQ